MNRQTVGGWSEAPLRLLLDLLESGSRPRGGVRGIRDGIPSLGGEHVNATGGFDFSSVKYVPEAFYERMNRGHVKSSDILIVKDGATTGKVALVRDDFPYKRAVVNEHVFICRPHGSICPQFLFWFLWSGAGQDGLLENFQGSAQGGINQGFADNIDVPVAPLAEQQRIAERIEALLARVTAVREQLERVPQLLARFRQAVRTAACEGRLTEGWREAQTGLVSGDSLRAIISHERLSVDSAAVDPDRDDMPDASPEALTWDIPQSWAWIPIEECLSYTRKAAYGVLQPGHEVSGGIPFVRIGDLAGGTVSVDCIKHIAPQVDAQYPRTRLQGGEVLVSLVGTIGRVAVAPTELAGANVARAIAMLPLCPHVLPPFMRIVLTEDRKNTELNDLAREVARKTLNLGLLKAVLVPLPSREEQQEIVRRVQAVFTVADAIERRVNTALAKAHKLPESILERAFAGELVTNEAELAQEDRRSYETADDIIVRIRKERAEAAKNTERRMPRASASRPGRRRRP